MTGPFAPEPPDGADRWSDQDPPSVRTPDPPADQVGAPDQVDGPDHPDELTQRPETAAPETAAPETAAPETAAPETAAPETAAPETAAEAPAAADPTVAAAAPVSLVKAERPPVSGAPAVDTPTARPAETADQTPLVPTDPAHIDPPQPPPPGRPLGRRGVLPLVLVGLLTVLMVAGVAFLGLQLRSEAQTETAREEAVAASRDAARLLFSYDHATLDEDFAMGLSVTTDGFRDEYARTTEQVVTDVARQYKAVVVADVVESAVVEDSPHEVTTLVFLNQATTSTQIQGRQVDQSRVRMRLVEQDGRWLVAEVQAL